jgi:hypothetical protein
MDLVAKVDAVLADWQGAAERLEAARAVVRAQPTLAAIDAARLLEVTLHVNVLACSSFAVGHVGSAPAGGAGAPAALWAPAAYLVAAALHFVAPAASATLHAGVDAPAFNDDAAPLLASAGVSGGALAFVRVAPSSPLCTPPMTPRARGAAALAAAHFGNADVAAALSWRAVPLQRAALSAWAAALRASGHAASTLRLRGVLLGVLWVQEGDEPPPFTAALDADGALVMEPAGAAALEWEAAADEGAEVGGGAALPRGAWVDLRRLASHGAPLSDALETDPPAMDNVHAMEEAGVRVAEVEAPQHAALQRAAGMPTRNGAAFLCGHTAFRAIAGATIYLEHLCGSGAVGFP